MNPQDKITIFISYSRDDTEFVNRLEADLVARDYLPWVDRQRLEGGQNWATIIQQEIERCQLFILVLTPSAVASLWVQKEILHAVNEGKFIIPLLLNPVEKVPLAINNIQWIDFHQNFNGGLSNLLLLLAGIAVMPPSPVQIKHLRMPPQIEDFETDLVIAEPPTPIPDPAMNDLFNAGMEAKANGEFERAAIFWQRIIDRESTFGNGLVAREMVKLEKVIAPIRIDRLRKLAKEAHVLGEWGKEIGAWEALLSIISNDNEALSSIKIAEENQKWAWLYQNAQAFVDAKKMAAAKETLTTLWQEAPSYGDPSGLAPLLGMVVPQPPQQSPQQQSGRAPDWLTGGGRTPTS